MHIVFINPQGNFDAGDSYLAEHPDFGGQLVYVKEVAQAMVELGHKVDIVTRRIRDVSWPEFSGDQGNYVGFENGLKILRFPCGGDQFLEKERLWPHLPELVTNMLTFYGRRLPDFITTHYADGGYSGILTLLQTGVPFTFTGHSLGAQKLDKLGTTVDNWSDMDSRYNFSRRIDAERQSMAHAARIIVSTRQEQEEQYAHPLYQGASGDLENKRFAVTPPGVNERIFKTKREAGDHAVWIKLNSRFESEFSPAIVVSSRLDAKKNILGLVNAFASSRDLRDTAFLVLCVRGIDDPERDIKKLGNTEQAVLRQILSVIRDSGMSTRVKFLNIKSQSELAATYRFFAHRRSVFALTSFYEPFGLAPIEAAAAGLAPVVTRIGGPTEIFKDGAGILVDPLSPDDIAKGLLDGLNRYDEITTAAIRRVRQTYTWRQTARGYIDTIEEALFDRKRNNASSTVKLDATSRIMKYLRAS